MSVGFFIELGVRLLLVTLFLPFSALDKIIDFRGAVAQAKQKVPSEAPAVGLILAGLGVEIIMSLGVVTGIADRLAALLLSGYCLMTALLWKQFWTPGDFWRTGESKGRNLFWDFLKNISLAGGFLLITFGTSEVTARQFFAHPLASSQPYATFHPIHYGTTDSPFVERGTRFGSGENGGADPHTKGPGDEERSTY